jgi:hypothetical protein
VALSDIESKTLYTETINRSSDFDGVKEKYTKPVSIPDGFQLASYEKEILHKKGTPNVDIVNAPMTGAKGDVSFEIHIGLDAFYKEAVRVRIKVVAEPTPEIKASYDNALRAWREEQIQKSIADLSKKKMEEVSGMINTPWPPSELMRRIIIDYFGQTPIDYGMMHRFETLFEWENLSYELHAPWSKPIDVNGLQSLQVGFDNASYATVYVPIRPGYEALAVSYLISLGALGLGPQLLPLMASAIQSAVAGFITKVYPKFENIQEFDDNDAKNIDGPSDIMLTEGGKDTWDSDFESELPFEVIDRFAVTIPTDGVDIEEAPASCEIQSKIRDADERIAQAEAKIKEVIAEKAVGAGSDIQVTVNLAGKT